jgi:hypothetical protein
MKSICAKTTKIAALALLTLPVLFAEASTIGFENFNTADSVYIEVSSPLQYTNTDGSDVTVTFVAGAGFKIYDLSRYGYPAATGHALLDWPGTNYVGTTIFFDAPVKDFSLQAGDFGGDDDSPLTITAYDSTNNIVGTASTLWPTNQFPPFVLLSVSATNIRKVVYSSGGLNPGSTFIDNVTFTQNGAVVPPWIEIRRDTNGNNFVDFNGRLEESSDLVQWTPVNVPFNSSYLITNLLANKDFFRARSLKP